MRALLIAIAAFSFTDLALTDLAYADSPLTPVIQEPEVDGQIVNPADVHMETAPFSDPDPGDGHLCSDFEIRMVSTDQVVWAATCISGLEAVHAHFGDGAFVGPLSGETQLEHDTDYRLRIRHRDDSGDPTSEWSDWSERLFLTGPATQIFPLEGDDVLDGSAPSWIDVVGEDVILPDSSVPASLILENSEGVLLEIQAIAGPVNLVINPPVLAEHAPILVRISPGDLPGGLTLPQSQLDFTDHEEEDHVIYLPPMQVSSGTEALFWVSSVGASYQADPSDTEPDFSDLAQGIPVPWISHQPGYKVEIVASGFRLPVNMAFHPAPDPTPGAPLYYVTELYGSIKVVTNEGTVSDFATDLLDYTPTGAFPGSGEQGVTGIAVDPATRDVFASMLYDGGGPHYPKVVRFSSSDGGLTASGETIILDMVGESQGQSHQISNLSFGPDGKLYVHMGDGFDAFTAQNLDSYRGKILRVNPDGTAPIDNPFYDALDGINARDYVFAYGLRNPFGGAWRSEDGFHYEVENGPSTDRFAKVIEGQNYGWNGSDSSMTQSAILTWAPAVGPTNIAFVQPELFGGSLFPDDSQGHAFVADSGPTWASGVPTRGKRIREYILDADGDLVAGPIDFVQYVGTGKATACGLAAGPDGLYFTDLYKDLDPANPTELGANVLRVKFVGAADFTADVTDGLAPLTVNFTDTSNVPAPSGWEWDFGDGGASVEQNPSHTYDVDGIYTVRLTVTGANGVAVEEKPGFIRVGDFPTVALIGSQLLPTPAEETVAEELESLGFEVQHYDDDPANRPPASVIAADHDLVVIPSTILSGNIAGEFRDQPVPLITWENALVREDREPLAGGGTVMASQTAIELVDDTHPITAGLALGLHDVFQTPSTMSVATDPFAVGAEILATRAGFAAHATILVADAGAVLLGGHIAPEKRAFLFFEDACLVGTTPFARELFRRAVLWATDDASAAGDVFTRGDCNGDASVNIADPVRLLGYLFASETGLECLDACDANDDGALDVADVIFELTSLFDAGAPIPAPDDCGTDDTLDALSCASSPCP